MNNLKPAHLYRWLVRSPTSLIIFPNRAVSILMIAANSSGVLVTVSDPGKYSNRLIGMILAAHRTRAQYRNGHIHHPANKTQDQHKSSLLDRRSMTALFDAFRNY